MFALRRCVVRAGLALIYMGAPDRLIIWRPGYTNNFGALKPMFIRLFRPGTGLANIFEGACLNCR